MARTIIRPPRVAMQVSTSAANAGAIYAAASRRDGATTCDEAYDNDGGLILTITCNKEDGGRLMEDIVDATRGGAMLL